MENKSRAWTKWLFWFTLIVASIFVYKTLDNIEQIGDGIKKFLGVISPILVGILISYILYVPCRKIEATYSKVKKSKFVKKKARSLSILTVYLIVFLIFIILINVILPPVVRSIIDLVANLGHYYNVAIIKIQEMPTNSLIKSEDLIKIINQAKDIDLTEFIKTQNVTSYLQSAVGMVGGIFNVFVSIVVSIYILSSRTKIIQFLERLTGAIFKEKVSNNINKYFNRTNEFFFKFLASQIMDAFIVGILASIAMAVMGIKYAVLLGFMIGLFNIIPYFGAIVAIGISAIITLLTGGLGHAIWMIIIVTILQQIDANIINPRIVGNSLKMSPLLVIIAVMIGGAYFGVLGMFLAVPVAAVLKLLIDDFIEWRKKENKILE